MFIQDVRKMTGYSTIPPHPFPFVNLEVPFCHRHTLDTGDRIATFAIHPKPTNRGPTLMSCSLGAWNCSNIAVTPGSMGRSSVNKCAALRFKYFLKKDFHAGRVKAPIGFFDASVSLRLEILRFASVVFFLETGNSARNLGLTNTTEATRHTRQTRLNNQGL